MTAPAEIPTSQQRLNAFLRPVPTKPSGSSPNLRPLNKRSRQLSTPCTPEQISEEKECVLDSDNRDLLDDIIETKLTAAIKPYLEMIEQLWDIITEKVDRIKQLEAQVLAISSLCNQPPPSSHDDTIINLAVNMEAHEQRSRSWNVRLSGVKADDIGISTDALIVEVGPQLKKEGT